MKKKAIIRWFYLSLVLIGIILILVPTKFHAFNKDYTKEYGVYKAVKGYESLPDLKNYLSDNKIEYLISNSKLTLKKYDLIEFEIENNLSCKIASNDILNKFELLDKESYSSVQISATVRDNKIVEEVYLTSYNVKYSKILGKYEMYKMGNAIAFFAFGTVFLSLGISLFTCNIVISIQKKKNKKQALFN